MNDNLKRKINSLATNKGNEFLTQLDATYEVSDKLEAVVEAIKSIPQTVIPETVIPEQKEVVFPDVQKVEIINHQENIHDNSDIIEQLKILVNETRKKEVVNNAIELQSVANKLSSIIDIAQSEKINDSNKEISTLLNTINENIVSIDVPQLDYLKLANIIKENVNIKISGGNGTSMVTNIQGNQINPATFENQIASQQVVSEEALLLRRMVKIMESSAVTDVNKRQIVTVGSIAGTSLGTGISGTGAGAGVPVPNSPTAAAPQPSANTTYWQNVFVGPVDQRYLIKDQARNTYSNSIRSNLSF